VRLLISVLVCALTAIAGPVDFAVGELNAAMAERKIKAKNIIELSLDAPESFRIEPYRVGGAHITGGDLRGLMYGVLEAAAQVRATGKFAKASGTPAASLRGVRIALTPELEATSQEFWHSYFQTLARQRFNRVHVQFTALDPPYRLVQFLSRTAVDYGIDFTLGIAGEISADDLSQILVTCPMIRGVALETGSPSRVAVLNALRRAGRRVTLDLDGATVESSVLVAALEMGVPLLRPASAWPPSFEIAPPPIDAAGANAHPLFYRLVGRLGYDPKAELPKELNPEIAKAAQDAALWIAAAEQSNLGGSDYIAAAGETAANKMNRTASAKFTPADIALRLDAAAQQLQHSPMPDLRLLSGIAQSQADQQRGAVNLPPAARRAPPTAWTHSNPLSAPSEQPLALSLRLAQPKEIAAVRLHYRTLDPAASGKTLEIPAAAENTFTIPAAGITGNWDLRYFFEVIGRDGGAWFEPDPLAAAPYWNVHVIAPHVGRN
jgi:hypothetical protein